MRCLVRFAPEVHALVVPYTEHDGVDLFQHAAISIAVVI